MIGLLSAAVTLQARTRSRVNAEDRALIRATFSDPTMAACAERLLGTWGWRGVCWIVDDGRLARWIQANMTFVSALGIEAAVAALPEDLRADMYEVMRLSIEDRDRGQ